MLIISLHFPAAPLFSFPCSTYRFVKGLSTARETLLLLSGVGGVFFRCMRTTMAAAAAAEAWRSYMSRQSLLPQFKSRPVNSRFCNVSGCTTELLEVAADDPKLRVVFIPGNPGVVAFYKDFLESLYELLGGIATVTAIAHISATKEDWCCGRLFSLQEQIDHKVDFIRQELWNIEVPIVLVGHSIGAYMAIETLRRTQEKVMYCVALYPFLMLNPQSGWQPIIRKISESSVLSVVVSFIVAFLGLLPKWTSRLLVLNSIGRSWSGTAVEAACSQLMKYHILRNVLFLTMTEFKKLSETPDWAFMRENQEKITFLFGDDDHWGPLEMFEEIKEQVPGVALSIEREGHTHNFSCTEAGSRWVAQHVATLVKAHISSSKQ